MAEDIASFSVTVLPERIVTVKSGIKFPVFGESKAVRSWDVLTVIVAEKVADIGVVDAGKQGADIRGGRASTGRP